MSSFEYRQLINKKSSLENIRKYFKKNPNILLKVERKIYTPLIVAVKAKRVDVVKMLFEEFDVKDIPDFYGKTASQLVEELYSLEELKSEGDLVKYFHLRNFLNNCK